MIQFESSNQKAVKAVGMISGGLDSSLAAKIMKDLGVDVYGVYFSMPWGCCDKTKALEVAQKIGIKFIVLQLDERYLEIVRKPRYGYGTAMNPCRDCRIHMFSRAAQYMRHIGAEFVFTGEVVGQRPMSQMKDSMRIIEEQAGLKGRLVRPLCAQLLEPTEVETSGLIDRNKLLDLNGRGRGEQIALARELDITYNQPAGGCLLTDKLFAVRMKDTLDHGYRNFRETIALKWGRHFRWDAGLKVILGRDKEENESLILFAHPDDTIMQLTNNLGPTAIVKGNPTNGILAQVGGLIQRFSRYKDETSVDLRYWVKKDKEQVHLISSQPVAEDLLARITL